MLNQSWEQEFLFLNSAVKMLYSIEFGCFLFFVFLLQAHLPVHPLTAFSLAVFVKSSPGKGG